MINKGIYTRVTNICKGLKKTQIYMSYEPQKMSVFVTQFSGTRLQVVPLGCIIALRITPHLLVTLTIMYLLE